MGMEGLLLLSEVTGWGRGRVIRKGLQKLAWLDLKILAEVLNDRSLSDAKPTLCVCDSLPYHTHFLVPAPFSLWESCKYQLTFFDNRNSRNKHGWGG